MKHIIAKTFGGLSWTYFLWHFVWGLAVMAAFVFLSLKSVNSLPPTGHMLLLTANAVLYPYSRFVYESVVGFIMGENIFVAPTLVFLGAKVVTIIACFIAAIFVAPIGLAYLYYHHTKQEQEASFRSSYQRNRRTRTG